MKQEQDEPRPQIDDFRQQLVTVEVMDHFNLTMQELIQNIEHEQPDLALGLAQLKYDAQNRFEKTRR